jgi:RNA polymerase sigma-70 factor (ECF subfamily)
LQDQDALEMKQVQAGQLDRFATLVGRYQSPLFRYAQSRLGNRPLSEEAVQETFLAVYRSRQSYDPERSFAAWIWTIHANTCRRIGRQRPTEETACLPEIDLTGGISPLAQAEIEDDRQRLLHVLEQLPPSQAEAVRLRFFGELAFNEIGAALGCGTCTAKSRVRSGLSKMAALLGVRQESAYES